MWIGNHKANYSSIYSRSLTLVLWSIKRNSTVFEGNFLNINSSWVTNILQYASSISLTSVLGSKWEKNDKSWQNSLEVITSNEIRNSCFLELSITEIDGGSEVLKRNRFIIKIMGLVFNVLMLKCLLPV